MEFTKEQQEYIDKLLLESKNGLFTEDELERRVTAEVDRRVESGIQKGLETHKSKWKKEFEQEAQLTAEELAQKQLDSKLEEITNREKEIQKRSNTIDAMDMMTGADISKEQYSKFIDLLVTDDSDNTKENVQNFIDTFNSTKTEIESKLKKELSRVPSPSIGDDSSGSDIMTKDKFDNLSYIERLELKRTDEKLYNEFNEKRER